MKLLAIDTSTSLASVALSMDGVEFVEEKPSLNDHATCLLPMIALVLKAAGCELRDLDGLVFGEGPGSFTGLRIACSVAKGLAYVHALPLFAVSGLDAIACQVRHKLSPDTDRLVMLDARMNQVYWAHVTHETRQALPCVSDASSVLFSCDRPLCLVGVGFEPYVKALPRVVQDALVTQQVVYPHATGLIQYVEEQRPSARVVAEAQPLYVRNQVVLGASCG